MPVIIAPGESNFFYVRAAVPAAAPAAASKSVVDRLVAILARTKSKDTFAVTVAALGQLGPDARVALPDIIENAERLGVLEGICAPGGCKSAHGEGVLQALAAIAAGGTRSATSPSSTRRQRPLRHPVAGLPARGAWATVRRCPS
jgi:hypothetical protein